MTIDQGYASIVRTANHEGGDSVYGYSKLIITKNKDGILFVRLEGYKNETLYSRPHEENVDWLPIDRGTDDLTILNLVVAKFDLQLVHIERSTATHIIFEDATFWLEQLLP